MALVITIFRQKGDHPARKRANQVSLGQILTACGISPGACAIGACQITGGLPAAGRRLGQRSPKSLHGREASTGRGACLSVSLLLTRPAGWRSEEKFTDIMCWRWCGREESPQAFGSAGGYPLNCHQATDMMGASREDTTSTSTRAVQENSNVRFNIDWEVAEPPAWPYVRYGRGLPHEALCFVGM